MFGKVGSGVVVEPFEATIKNPSATDPYLLSDEYSWFDDPVTGDENPTLLVDWGDGSEIQTITDWAYLTHQYATYQETYRIKIWVSESRLRILRVKNIETVHTWGAATVDFFQIHSPYIIQVPPTLPSYVTKTTFMFENSPLFNADISAWDTVNVTNMHTMFSGCTAFNQPISNWNTSNVTNMDNMFTNASSFNQPLNWDVSNVTGMWFMFGYAASFSQDLSKWCVAKIINPVSNFGVGSLMTPEQLPVWGTCPNPI